MTPWKQLPAVFLADIADGCVKGIYYRFKEIMDLIGHEWPKANEGVAITIDSDIEALTNVTVGDV